MLNFLYKKMSACMLWTLIIPFALLIIMLSSLIASYAYVVFKSDQVSYAGSLGKFEAKISSVQQKLQRAQSDNDRLTKSVTQLKKSLNELKTSCSSQANFESKNEAISNTFRDLFENLNNQSNLIIEQKEKLNSVNKDIFQFKQDLKRQSKSYNQLQ